MADTTADETAMSDHGEGEASVPVAAEAEAEAGAGGKRKRTDGDDDAGAGEATKAGPKSKVKASCLWGAHAVAVLHHAPPPS